MSLVVGPRQRPCESQSTIGAGGMARSTKQATPALRLTLEARAAIRVVAQFRAEDLDRDRAVEAGVAGPVNLSHAPGADQPEDLVRTKPRTRSQRHVEARLPL